MFNLDLKTEGVKHYIVGVKPGEEIEVLQSVISLAGNAMLLYCDDIEKIVDESTYLSCYNGPAAKARAYEIFVYYAVHHPISDDEYKSPDAISMHMLNKLDRFEYYSYYITESNHAVLQFKQKNYNDVSAIIAGDRSDSLAMLPMAIGDLFVFYSQYHEIFLQNKVKYRMPTAINEKSCYVYHMNHLFEDRLKPLIFFSIFEQKYAEHKDVVYNLKNHRGKLYKKGYQFDLHEENKEGHVWEKSGRQLGLSEFFDPYAYHNKLFNSFKNLLPQEEREYIDKTIPKNAVGFQFHTGIWKPAEGWRDDLFSVYRSWDFDEAQQYINRMFKAGHQVVVLTPHPWVDEIKTCIQLDKLSIAGYAYAVSRLGLHVGIDSSGGHVAAAYNIPNITIWGTATTPTKVGDSAASFRPLRKNISLYSKHNRYGCDAMYAEDVVQYTLDVLDGKIVPDENVVTWEDCANDKNIFYMDKPPKQSALSQQIAAFGTTSNPYGQQQLTPPMITSHPSSTSTVVGGSASFSVSASGSQPMSFTWCYFDGSSWPSIGSSSSTLTLSNVTADMNGRSFHVFVQNELSFTVSDSATLTVTASSPSTPYTQTPYTQTPYTQTPYTQTPYTQTPYTQTPYTQPPETAPSISLHPQSRSTHVGSDNITFSVTASGSRIYQWQRSTDGGSGWSNLDGETSSTLTLPLVTANMSGWQYRVRVMNPNNTSLYRNSDSATLTVSEIPRPGTPYALNATDIRQTTATLFWSVPAGNQVLYNIELRLLHGEVALRRPSATNTFYHITNLIAGSRYEFRVRASRGNHVHGEWSDWRGFELSNATVFNPRRTDFVMLEYILNKNNGRITNQERGTNHFNEPFVRVWIEMNGRSGFFSTEYRRGLGVQLRVFRQGDNEYMIIDSSILMDIFDLAPHRVIHQSWDRFNTMNDAAIAFSLMWTGHATNDNREWGALIYRVSNFTGAGAATHFSFGTQWRGAENNVVAGFLFRFMFGEVGTSQLTTPVALAHTHPRGRLTFSPYDMNVGDGVYNIAGVGIPALPVFMSVMHQTPSVQVNISKYDYTMLRNDEGVLLLRL